MSETINFTNELERDTFASWFLLNAMCNVCGRDIRGVFGIKDEQMEVCLTVNGIEVPVKSTLEEMNRQMDEMLRREAKKVLNERINDVMIALDQLEERASEILDTEKENIKLDKLMEES